jgi:hypothetical protein
VPALRLHRLGNLQRSQPESRVIFGCGLSLARKQKRAIR